jgi:uncharacterized protein YndB with AHSA1/START domain
MEHKTHVHAEAGKQEILITRTFDLPVALLFRAYTEAKLVEQWMGNKVLKLENQAHGGYQFETRDEQGNVLFRANGSIHSLIENQNITRTFEMENTPFPAQLEFLDFEAIDADTSRLSMIIIFKSVEDRDNLLKMPFAKGIHRAHNQLQSIISTYI